MSTASQFNPNYSVADYQQWHGDWELLDGVAIAMGPSPFGSHQRLASRIFMEVVRGLNETKCQSFEVIYEIDWIVNQHTVVRPDIVVVDCVPEKHVESPPALIVEVISQSTEQKDRTYKFELFQAQQVPFYLMADPQTKRLEVYRLNDGRYQLQQQSETYHLDLSLHCTVELDTQHIFDR